MQNIKYTMINGITVPELADIVTFIEQQIASNEFVINVTKDGNTLKFKQTKNGVQEEVDYTVDLSNYYTKSAADNKFAWQSDLNGYVAKTGGSMTGALNMGYNKIGQLQAPVLDYDAVHKRYAEEHFLALTGGTLTGDLLINSDTTNLKLKKKNASSGQADLSYYDSADVRQGCMRYNGSLLQLGLKTPDGANWWNGAGVTLYSNGSSKVHSTATNGTTYYNLDLNNDGSLKWRGFTLLAKKLTMTAGTNVQIQRGYALQIANVVIVNACLGFTADVTAWNNIITGLPKSAYADVYFGNILMGTSERRDLYVSNTKNEIQSPNTMPSGGRIMVSIAYITNEN